jgi:hypothetical protein
MSYGTTIRPDTTLPAVIDRRAQRHHVAYVQAEACHVVAVYQHNHARAVDAAEAIIVAVDRGVEPIEVDLHGVLTSCSATLPVRERLHARS